MQAYDGSTWFSTFIGRAMKRTLNKTNGPFVNELCSSKNSIADRTATSIITVTIPNKDTSAMILLDYVVNSDEGVGTYRTGQARINIARNQGSNTTNTVDTSISQQMTPNNTVGIISADLTAAKVYQHSGFSSNVSNSFAAQGSNTYGIHWDGTDIFTVDGGGGNDKIYRHCRFAATVAASFSSPYDNPLGISWDGTDAYTSDTVQGGGEIYRHCRFALTIAASFSSPSNLPMDIYWDATNSKLYSVDANSSKIYKHSAFNNSIANSFTMANGPNSVWFDGVDVYSSDATADKIYQHSSFSATIEDSFSGPSNSTQGITYRYTAGDIVEITFTVGSLTGAASAQQTAPIQVYIKSMPANTANIRYFARILSGGYQDGESGCEVTLAAA